ncbi:unnamed protein product [Gongylonema pulchrum]|uniref:AGC-kinase C-terminal domain-containing protein n=1 Tax=Gongylonema pulchrum TaxID=637853 RepID=A0A183EJX1_9BILA|nr:unnamed protein product [Gongylonema pulchrum]
MVRHNDHFDDENYYDPAPLRPVSSVNDLNEMLYDISGIDQPRRLSEYDFRSVTGETSRQSQDFFPDIFGSLFRVFSAK